MFDEAAAQVATDRFAQAAFGVAKTQHYRFEVFDVAALFDLAFQPDGAGDFAQAFDDGFAQFVLPKGAVAFRIVQYFLITFDLAFEVEHVLFV